MKRFSIISLLFLIAFTSCEKEKNHIDTNTNPDYHFTFTADGVKKSFTGYIVAHADTASGYTTLIILGASSPTSFSDDLGIYIDNFPSMKNIIPGQYADNSADFTILTTYDNNGKSYEAGQSVAETGVTENIPIAHHFKVNITAMDKKAVKGTFSGDYFDDGNVKSGAKLNITDGDFYVKFQ